MNKDLLKPSLTDLIKQIHCINHAWKLSQEMEDNSHFLAIRLRDLKSRLQIKLLKNFAPNYVYLKEDKDIESEESIYGLMLVSPINNYSDVAHIPIRVAKKMLSEEEISHFSKSSLNI
ncbi:hypothetical protein WEU38_04330 [Cyanobacterium aponinum AL20118]|uniref:Uncharacterized protein n=1 Tax=Cyanobacterium aponinum AL20115 TaxID=3090662 RepID=A0AAF0ZD70_9CHRO|nr:hypothetical protein [Cyanobacterium aponinum]WPF89505.1 hypothetical protein SAY89_04345 [Cyanobacterium aponinum AL20115]